jgi:hypothetical protein
VPTGTELGRGRKSKGQHNRRQFLGESWSYVRLEVYKLSVRDTAHELMPESILVPQGQRRGLNRHANCYNPSLYNANEVVNATNSALLASSGAHPPLRERSGFIVDQTCNEGDHCQHLPTHLLYCRDTSSAPAIGSTEHRHLAETKSSSAAVEFEGTVRTHSVLPIIFATIDGIFSGIVLLACSLSTPTPVRPITPSYRR